MLRSTGGEARTALRGLFTLGKEFRLLTFSSNLCDFLESFIKCVSKVLGQMWALLALRGVPGLLRHILLYSEYSLRR